MRTSRPPCPAFTPRATWWMRSTRSAWEWARPRSPRPACTTRFVARAERALLLLRLAAAVARDAQRAEHRDALVRLVHRADRRTVFLRRGDVRIAWRVDLHGAGHVHVG